MKWNDISLRKKILVPIGLVGALMLILSALQINTLNKISSEYSQINSTYIPAIELTLNADRDMYQAQIAERSIALGDRRDIFFSMHRENLDQVLDRLQRIQKMPVSNQSKSLISSAIAEFNKWRPNTEQLVASSLRGTISTETATELSTGSLDREFEQVRELLNKLGEALSQEAEALQAEAESMRNSSLTTISLFIVLAAIGVVLTGIYFPRLITVPINKLALVLGQMADGRGDLRQRMPNLGTDEIGQLSANFNRFLTNMQNMIITIRDVANDVTSNSSSLDTSANNSQRISQSYEDAMNLVATANHEMSLAIQEVSANTQQVSEEAKTADKSARIVTEQFRSAMLEIQNLANNVNNSSGAIQEVAAETTNIASVLDVIKGIAEQTNLLALNAAIEAARAGEQGRGFAVVADEVRTLASKTQQSTGDINLMIEKLRTGVTRAVDTMQESKSKAEKTVEFAQQSEQSVRSISNALQSISDRILQIASAIEEQTSVINEINSNLSDAKDLSSQGSDSIAQINHAVVSLGEQALLLQKEIGNFSL